MRSLSTRCWLQDKTLPVAYFVLVVVVILTKVVLGLSYHRDVDILGLLAQLAFATGLFFVVVSGRPSIWKIVEVPSGIRMERDGAVLYEGPSSGIQIVEEDRGVMTLRSSGGSSFQFPRRRVFHEVVSQITVLHQEPVKPAGTAAGNVLHRIRASPRRLYDSIVRLK